MNIWGILIGLAAFLLIGIFHPIVIKCEYHFGAKIWPLFLVAGVLCCVASLLEQENRVRKGWFPANPRRKGCDATDLKTTDKDE